MKGPAQFLDRPGKRNMPSWETSPNKKNKLDVTEEDLDVVSESKHDFSIVLIDTRFSQDEIDSTVESLNDDDDTEENLNPLEISNIELNISSTLESSDEEEEGEVDLGEDKMEEKIKSPMEDSNKNFEIFLSELKKTIESDESNDGFPPTVSPSQYPIKECRVSCRKMDAAVKDEVKEEDEDDEIEILDDPACPQCGLSLQSVTTFTPGGGSSEAEVVNNKELNLISFETARREGWPFCLQTTNLTVYDNQDHMLSYDKVCRR